MRSQRCTYHRAPCRGEAENEQGSEDDERDAGALGVLRVVDVEAEVADGSEDDEADEHPQRTRDEGLTSTEVLDNVQTEEGRAEVDGVQDDLRDEGADVDGSEDGGAIVKEVVGAGELCAVRNLASRCRSGGWLTCWNICRSMPRAIR